MEINKILQEATFFLDPENSYLVGGFVRDLLLNKLLSNPNIDIVTEAEFEKTKSLIRSLKINHSVYEKMLTLKVEIGENILDIVRARREFYKAPGVIAYTEPASLREDIFRRDFSINALLIRLGDFLSKNYYPIDLVSGLNDLRDKKLRILKSDSFYEDPARLIRLIRYAVKLDFNIDELTYEKYKDCVESSILFTSRSSRIILEMKRLFDESQVSSVLSTLERIKLPPLCSLLSHEFLERANGLSSSKEVFKRYFDYDSRSAEEFFKHFGCSIHQYVLV